MDDNQAGGGKRPGYPEKVRTKKGREHAGRAGVDGRAEGHGIGVLDKLLTAMSNDEIIGKSTISQIATAFGVVTDKFMTLRTQQEVHPLLKDIAEAMKEKP